MITLAILAALANTSANLWKHSIVMNKMCIYYKGSAVVQMWEAPTGSWVWTLGPGWWCLLWKAVNPSVGGPLLQGSQRVGLISYNLSCCHQSSLLPHCLPDNTPSFPYHETQYPQTLGQYISCLPGFCQVRWQDPGSPKPAPSCFCDFLLRKASDCRRLAPFPLNISRRPSVIVHRTLHN